MQKTLRLLAGLTLSLSVLLVSCKKEDKDDNSSQDEITTHNEDQTMISTSMDDVANDVGLALESSVTFSGKPMDGQDVQDIIGVCNASVTIDSASNPRTITITYTGNNCIGNYKRAGAIVLSMPAGFRWKNAGAALTVTYQNLIITRLSDNKRVKLNGSETITNVTGGLLLNLSNMGTITHTLTSANMSIGFPDSTSRTWQIARQRTFTFNQGINLSISGLHSENGITGITEWGTNRFGHAFTTAITSPLVFKQSCAGRLTAGEIKHQGFGTATVKFGLNASGGPTSCPGTGSYYFKLSWTGPGGNTYSSIHSY